MTVLLFKLIGGMGGLSGLFNLSQLAAVSVTRHGITMLIGAAMTVIMQSSSAAVATTLTPLHTGSINFEQAAAPPQTDRRRHPGAGNHPHYPGCPAMAEPHRIPHLAYLPVSGKPRCIQPSARGRNENGRSESMTSLRIQQRVDTDAVNG